MTMKEQNTGEFDAVLEENDKLRALLREAIEDLDGLPAGPHSWLGRVRATLGV